MRPSVLCEVLGRKKYGRNGYIAWSKQWTSLASHNVALHIIEVVEELDSFDSGGTHQVLDSLFFSQLILLGQESF